MNGLKFKRTGCSSGGPEFDSQYSLVGSQPSVAALPGDLISSLCLQGHQASKLCAERYAGKEPINIKQQQQKILLTSYHIFQGLFSRYVFGVNSEVSHTGLCVEYMFSNWGHCFIRVKSI